MLGRDVQAPGLQAEVCVTSQNAEAILSPVLFQMAQQDKCLSTLVSQVFPQKSF